MNGTEHEILVLDDSQSATYNMREIPKIAHLIYWCDDCDCFHINLDSSWEQIDEQLR